MVRAYDDQLNPVSFRRLNDIVQTLEAVGTGVDACYAVDEGLVVDGAGAGDAGHVIETPNTEDLLARGLEVLHNGVDIGVVGQEADPIRVGAGEVLLLAIDHEGGAAGRGDGSGRRSGG